MSEPRYVVERDWRGPYAVYARYGLVHRTLTERGAIHVAKRLNRKYELMNQKPVRVWPKEDQNES